jgi:DNA-binding PucR family transcriptional regulator
MSICCRELFALPSLQKLTLVAGEKGLDQEILWTHVADVPNMAEWVEKGDLLFTTGIHLPINTDEFVELIHQFKKKGLAGLVLNIGPYIKAILQEVIEAADELAFPLFSLPWECRLAEVTQEICRLLIKDQMSKTIEKELIETILLGNIEQPEEVINQAAIAGYDLTQPQQVVIFTELKSQENIEEPKNIHRVTQQIIHENFIYYHIKVLSLVNREEIIVLIPSIKEDKLSLIVGNIVERIAARSIDSLIHIGIGNISNNLIQVRKSLEQARQALRFAALEGKSKVIVTYAKLGALKLLLKIQDRQELECFYQETLGPLLTYDQEYGPNLIDTLVVFLQENGQAVKAAEKLFIHRNTLKYRLQRAEEILGLDLSDSDARITIQIAFMAGRLLQS